MMGSIQIRNDAAIPCLYEEKHVALEKWGKQGYVIAPTPVQYDVHKILDKVFQIYN